MYIRGSGFDSNSSVNFGATPGTNVSYVSSSELVAVAPSENAGTVDVTVATAGGTSSTSSADQYTFWTSPPEVTGLAPTSGPTAGGNQVDVFGNYFVPGAVVYFGTTPSTYVQYLGVTEVQAVAPALSAGTVDVTVTTPYGTSSASSADQYTYTNPIPEVTSINPTWGPPAGGTVVSIYGTGFSSATVDFGTTPSPSVQYISANELQAVAPAESAGTVDVTVTTAYGTSATSSADQYTFTSQTQPPPACPTGATHLAPGEPWAVAAMSATVNGHVCPGYWVVTRTGGVTSMGVAPFLGDMSGRVLNAAMVGIAATPDGKGYYLLGGDGGIFNYGDAAFHGSTGNLRLNAPVVAMSVDSSGSGYWLVASDGGIFNFGDAPYLGSEGGTRLNQPVVGMSTDPQTGGYWLVASDGGIFNFDAPFYGSTGGQHLNQPVVGMTPQPDGGGYRLVASDGGVFTFGDAAFYGSLPGEGVQNPQVTTMAGSVDGNGYYLINGAGTIWAFGDAPYLGNA